MRIGTPPSTGSVFHPEGPRPNVSSGLGTFRRVHLLRKHWQGPVPWWELSLYEHRPRHVKASQAHQQESPERQFGWRGAPSDRAAFRRWQQRFESLTF